MLILLTRTVAFVRSDYLQPSKHCLTLAALGSCNSARFILDLLCDLTAICAIPPPTRARDQGNTCSSSSSTAMHSKSQQCTESQGHVKRAGAAAQHGTGRRTPCGTGGCQDPGTVHICSCCVLQGQLWTGPRHLPVFDCVCMNRIVLAGFMFFGLSCDGMDISWLLLVAWVACDKLL